MYLVTFSFVKSAGNCQTLKSAKRSMRFGSSVLAVVVVVYPETFRTTGSPWCGMTENVLNVRLFWRPVQGGDAQKYVATLNSWQKSLTNQKQAPPSLSGQLAEARVTSDLSGELPSWPTRGATTGHVVGFFPWCDPVFFNWNHIRLIGRHNTRFVQICQV